MNTPTHEIAEPATTRFGRFLANPFARILIAIIFIAIPIFAIYIALHLFVEDKALQRVAFLLLAAYAVTAYCIFVRKVEKREISEFALDGVFRDSHNPSYLTSRRMWAKSVSQGFVTA